MRKFFSRRLWISLALVHILSQFSTAQAAVTFALRGDNLAPRYALGGKEYMPFVGAPNLATLPAVITASSIGATGTKGTSLIDVHRTNGDERAIMYHSGASWVTGTNVFSIRYSFVPNWTGNPPVDQTLFIIGGNNNFFNGGIRVQLFDNGKMFLAMRTGDSVGSEMLSGAVTASALSFTTGVKTEIMVVSDGTTVYASQDGVQVGSWALAVTNRYMNSVIAGKIYLGVYSVDTYIDEFVIWDSVEAHVYTPTSSYLTVADFDGLSSTDPGVGNVLTGTSYTIYGIAKTGTYDPTALYTDPGVANVLDTTSWKFGSATNNRTGTYSSPTTAQVKTGISFGVGLTGTLTCTDPGISNVSNGVGYQVYSTSYTGTRLSVTNVLSGATMSGAERSAVLTAQ